MAESCLKKTVTVAAKREEKVRIHSSEAELEQSQTRHKESARILKGKSACQVSRHSGRGTTYGTANSNGSGETHL